MISKPLSVEEIKSMKDCMILTNMVKWGLELIKLSNILLHTLGIDSNTWKTIDCNSRINFDLLVLTIIVY
jgi:hypothetical protein